ncbi:hypothetical protein MKW98_003862 [Papaver atlanticum]|uniref:Alpha/beta hydrolase fold-3 domain-containing protein n=1 Tax=Papaver atlanticum TaxID=357466 RepID=A0AAD4XUR1_9MAGN|nr:hypothetical protein MKW98_003862 [Papaver atlanticum]
MDPYKVLYITPNKDGSLTRYCPVPEIPPTGINDNPTNKTWVRVFRPLNLPSVNNLKLPVVIYFHPGGFVICSTASSPFHQFCTKMASELQVLVVSVEYRLAPENRLPCAYEDAIGAILWVKNQALMKSTNAFICENVDFSRCFLMGASSGGNIAYHAGLRSLHLDLNPVKIIGLVLNQPFFGGVERTNSETKFVHDKVFPLCAADLLWELALPSESDRDHEYSNPIVGASKCSGDIGLLPECYVRGCGGDPLIDRKGVKVVTKFSDEGFHSNELFDEEVAQDLVKGFKDFIYSSGMQTTSN